MTMMMMMKIMIMIMIMMETSRMLPPREGDS